MASVSCGSQSRFVGDLETSGRMIARRARSEKIGEIKFPQLLFVDLAGEHSQRLPVLGVAIDRGAAMLHFGQQMRCGRWRDPLRGEVTADVKIGRVFLFLDSLMLLPRLLYFLLLRPAAFVERAIAPLQIRSERGRCSCLPARRALPRRPVFRGRRGMLPRSRDGLASSRLFRAGAAPVPC